MLPQPPPPPPPPLQQAYSQIFNGDVVFYFLQGVTKRCRLPWLTKSGLIYEPKCGVEEGCGVSAKEYSCAHGAQINFGDLTPILFLANISLTDRMFCFLNRIIFLKEKKSFFSLQKMDPAKRAQTQNAGEVSSLQWFFSQSVELMTDKVWLHCIRPMLIK
jgi:hypothetical protein